MALLVYLLIIFFCVLALSYNAEAGPPNPGYYLTSKIASAPFNQDFTNLWGSQHQTIDQGTLTIWLDKTTGSGFKSRRAYSSGYFGAAVKLQPGYTAGVITSFYLSNVEQHPGDHDEIDIEFLGTTGDKPYVLQTNVYIRGSGDPGRKIIGREIKFHLWFDPTKDFHNYAILWTPTQIIFYVDDVPIRRYPRKSDASFPSRPMYVYGSIWDASPWATENGRYKVDYNHQPFVGRYQHFRIDGRPVSGSPSGSTGLSPQQHAAMTYVNNNYKIYDYCRDTSRDHNLTPEC